MTVLIYGVVIFEWLSGWAQGLTWAEPGKEAGCRLRREARVEGLGVCTWAGAARVACTLTSQSWWASLHESMDPF